MFNLFPKKTIYIKNTKDNASLMWICSNPLIWCVLFLLSSLAVAASQGDKNMPSATEILEKSDYIRNPQESFVTTLSLLEYTQKKQTNQMTLTVHSRKGKQGQFLSIVHFDYPANDKGKLILRNGNSLWVYDPKSKASVRISPRQRLAGNAANGDVVTSNFVMDYNAKLIGEESINDGDKQKRQAWKLDLTASNSYAPYNRVELWIDKENYRPLKGMFYGQSGNLLKTAWYRGWQPVLGETRPTEVVIADGFSTNKITVMKMSNHYTKELPLSWFNKEWLANFTPGNKE